jgi:hypothetical protein
MGKIFLIVFGIAVCIFILTFLIMISPKFRGKMMSRQIKAAKYMMDESEDTLRELATKSANIAKEGVKITSGAVNDGFSSWDMCCKYCGAAIDGDSIYCKKCGRKQ